MSTLLPSGPLDIMKRSAFSALPLDLLCEICGWLNPEDILALTRTAKSMRSYLMSRASRVTVWIPALRSLEHLDIPKCPETMSEPHLVHLLFDEFCDDCGQDSVLPIEYDYKMHRRFEVYRIICQGCFLKNYATFDELVREPTDLPWPCSDLRRMVDCLHPSYAGLVKESHPYSYSELSSDSESEKEKNNPSSKNQEDDGLRILLHIEGVRQLQRRWNGDAHLKREMEREAWIDRAMRGKFSHDCKRFHMVKESHEREAREMKYQERCAFIKQRLSVLGFESEAERFFQLESNPDKWTPHYRDYSDKYVRTRLGTKVLTEEDWLSMEEEFVSWMLTEREWWEVKRGDWNVGERIRRSFSSAFIAFAISADPNAGFPSPVEVLLMPEWVEALGQKPYTDRPDPSKVAAAVAAMPAFADGVRRMRIWQLLEVVRKSKTYAGRMEQVTDDTLTLASTVFRCTRCRDCIHYPNILVHYCNFIPPPQDEQHWRRRSLVPNHARMLKQVGAPEAWTSQPITQQEEKVLVYAFGRRGGFWNQLCNIEFGEAEHEHMVEMLDTLGMDRKTTSERMEQDQPYVKGLCQCFTRRMASGEPKRVMRWMKALYECREHGKEEKRKKWFAKIDKTHIALVPDAERERSLLRTQACFWGLNRHGNTRTPWLIDTGDYARDLNALETGRRYVPWNSWDSNSLVIKHPLGDDALREYVKARTLVSSEQLRKERPLVLRLRRSDRKKSDGLARIATESIDDGASGNK